MPIIVGAPRSGTTLLRLMLDAHTDLAIPPETGFLATDQTFLHRLSRQEFADFIEQFPPGVPGWQDFCIPFPVWREALEAIEPFSPVNAFRTFYRLYAARFSKMRWGGQDAQLRILHEADQGDASEIPFYPLDSRWEGRCAVVAKDLVRSRAGHENAGKPLEAVGVGRSGQPEGREPLS